MNNEKLYFWRIEQLEEGIESLRLEVERDQKETENLKTFIETGVDYE